MLPAYQKALRQLYTPEINKILLDLREYRKRINRFLMANETMPALRTLHDRALLDAVLSNGRLDGSSVSETRLIELFEQGASPTNNKEAEVMGYRFTLNTIEDSFRYIRISTGAIAQLHRDLYRYADTSCAGRWADAGESTVFTGELERMAARRAGAKFVTKQALLRDACNNYRTAIETRQFDPIVESCMFMLDVINIAPFAEGNDRLARMLFQILAYQNGYMVFRYIPLAEQIESLGSKFTDALAACSRTIPRNKSEYDAKTNYEPFVVLMLQSLLDSCIAFDERFDINSCEAVAIEKPALQDKSAEDSAANLRHNNMVGVSREERMAIRSAMQEAAREILQQPVSSAFTGTTAEGRARAYRDASSDTDKTSGSPAASTAAAPATTSASTTSKTTSKSSNENVVRDFFDQLEGNVAKKDVVAACPTMSAKTVERMIQKLLAEGFIEKIGAARATRYRKA